MWLYKIYFDPQLFFLYGKTLFTSKKGTEMGARFAPSYANWYMSYWENCRIWEEQSLRSKPAPLCQIYIEDILIIWDGTDLNLEDFLEHCANNLLGILFTHVIDAHHLVFLDLELSSDIEGHILSKTHFKSKACNLYLHAQSNHHPRWIRNVPKGPILQITAHMQ